MKITAAPEQVDWPALFRLVTEAYAYMEGRIDPPSSLLAMTLSDFEEKAVRETLIVAHADAELVGCVFCRPQGEWLYIGKLAVATSDRRRGIARALIDRGFALAHDLGLAGLELETRIELVENHRAFESMGFSKIGESTHPGYTTPTSIRMRSALQSDES